MNFKNPDISILKNKKLYVFDMDGTIYLEDDVFPYAIRFIKNLRAAGQRILFFTNNASHSPEFYLNRLTRMGFDPRMSEIMTSGDVTAEFLTRHRAGKTGRDQLARAKLSHQHAEKQVHDGRSGKAAAVGDGVGTAGNAQRRRHRLNI